MAYFISLLYLPETLIGLWKSIVSTGLVSGPGQLIVSHYCSVCPFFSAIADMFRHGVYIFLIFLSLLPPSFTNTIIAL